MFSGEGVKAQLEGPAASGEGAFNNIVMQVCDCKHPTTSLVCWGPRRRGGNRVRVSARVNV
eukprot:1147734-Pelagomonas_calceolata.AAC.2